MGKAKPVYGTVEEIAQAKAELTARLDYFERVVATKEDLAQLTAKLETSAAELTKTITANVQALRDETAQTRNDCNARSDKNVAIAREELRDTAAQIEDKRANTQSHLEVALHLADQQLREKVDVDLDTLNKSLRDHIARVEACLQTNLAKLAADTKQLSAKQRKELEALRMAGEERLNNEVQVLRAETGAEFQRRGNGQREDDEARDDASRRSRAEVDARLEACMEECARVETTAGDSLERLGDAMEKFLEEVRHDTEVHLEDVDSSLAELKRQCGISSDGMTRRAEWRIPEVQSLLAKAQFNEKPYLSWFSRTFNAATAGRFRLEFRLYRAISKENKPSSPLSPKSPAARALKAFGAYECMLLLWANRGAHLHLRFFIGDRSQIVEKDFALSRDSAATKRLCCLRDQLSEDGSITVGVEFLESILENEVGQASKGLGRRTVGRGAINRDVVINSTSEHNAGLLDENASEDLQAELLADEDSAPGKLQTQRYINHRLLYQMSKEIERLQARLVRRVEWNLEQPSTLRSCFGHCEALCSPFFSAAGVEGFQLLFYPSGYTGVTDGFCSLFLYAPAGVTMQFNLSVGNKVREMHNTFVESGCCGRVNFCLYDTCFEAKFDLLTLALDIIEVKQEVGTSAIHQVSERTKKANMGENAASTVASAVKMMRAPKSESLCDVKVLPSLWSFKGFGDMMPSGSLNTFGDLPTPIRTRRNEGDVGAHSRVGSEVGADERHDRGVQPRLAPPLPARRSGSTPALAARGGVVAHSAATSEEWSKEEVSSLPTIKTNLSASTSKLLTRPGSHGPRVTLGGTMNIPYVPGLT